MRSIRRQRHRHPRNAAAALAAGTLALGGSLATVHAAPFLYQPGDLLLTLRQTGGASDLVVNLGRVAQFEGLPAGTTVALTNLSSAQFGAAFPGANALRWSVAAANRPPIDPAFPLQTLWVTAPRTDPDTPAPPLAPQRPVRPRQRRQPD